MVATSALSDSGNLEPDSCRFPSLKEHGLYSTVLGSRETSQGLLAFWV